MRLRNREEAALRIAERLSPLKGSKPLVLGTPRGAQAMARIVAEALDGDLDVALVGKISAPGVPELVIGAVSESGDVVVTGVAAARALDEDDLAREAHRQFERLRARRKLLATCPPPIDPTGRVVVIVDDGAVTGSTMLAALHALRQRRPKWLVAAVAVAPRSALALIEEHSDDVVCLDTSDDVRPVGQSYVHFPTLTDRQVIETLQGFAEQRHAAPGRVPAIQPRAVSPATYRA